MVVEGSSKVGVGVEVAVAVAIDLQEDHVGVHPLTVVEEGEPVADIMIDVCDYYTMAVSGHTSYMHCRGYRWWQRRTIHTQFVQISYHQWFMQLRSQL
jgi:hypothetical protein